MRVSAKPLLSLLALPLAASWAPLSASWAPFALRPRAAAPRVGCDAVVCAMPAEEYSAVEAAADALLAVAQHEYHEVRGLEKMGDDTTVVVVDLNPGGLAYEDPIKGMGGVCCAVL